MAPRPKQLLSSVNSPPARKTRSNAAKGKQGLDSTAALLASIDSFVEGVNGGAASGQGSSSRVGVAPSEEDAAVKKGKVAKAGKGRGAGGLGAHRTAAGDVAVGRVRRDDAAVDEQGTPVAQPTIARKKVSPTFSLVIPKVATKTSRSPSAGSSTQLASRSQPKLQSKDVNRPTQPKSTTPLSKAPSFSLVIPKGNPSASSRSSSHASSALVPAIKASTPRGGIAHPSPHPPSFDTLEPVAEAESNEVSPEIEDVTVRADEAPESRGVFGRQPGRAPDIDYLQPPSGDSSDSEPEDESQDDSQPSQIPTPPFATLTTNAPPPAARPVPVPVESVVEPAVPSPAQGFQRQSELPDLDFGGGPDYDEDAEEAVDLPDDDPFGFAKAERQLHKLRRQGVIKTADLHLEVGEDDDFDPEPSPDLKGHADGRRSEMLDEDDDDDLPTAEATIAENNRPATPRFSLSQAPDDAESSPLSAVDSDYDEPMNADTLQTSGKRRRGRDEDESDDGTEVRSRKPRRAAAKGKSRAKKSRLESDSDDDTVRKTTDLVALLPRRRQPKARQQTAELLSSDDEEEEDDDQDGKVKKFAAKSKTKATTSKAKGRTAKGRKKNDEDDRSSTSEDTRVARKKRKAYYATLTAPLEEETVL